VTSSPLQVTAAVETAAVVAAAHRLGVLRRLTASPQTATELAGDLGLAPPATSRLLDTLVRLGLLRRDAGGSCATDPAAVRFLEVITEAWGNLSDVVRAGTPVTPADTADGAAALYPIIAPQLATWFAPAAARLGELLSPPPEQVLDVGAGAAPWSIAVAAGNEHTHITAIDLPAMLPVTRAAVAGAGLANRFRYLAGDVFTTDLPAAAYDLALVGNVCHLFGPELNRTLFGKLRRSVRPGGRIAIVDVLPATDPAEQLAVSRYDLGLLLRTSVGRVYPLADYLAWSAEAGFPDLNSFRLSSDPPMTLLLSQDQKSNGDPS
jgi:ubiquinone/menaquinone biosynthesis C-methylase UbiE